MPIDDAAGLLRLLQLASATLPVGAFAYSEGLEALIAEGAIAHVADLNDWMIRSLAEGSPRLESALALRARRAASRGDMAALGHWNRWLAATKETPELRQQSAQMGRALAELLRALAPESAPLWAAFGEPVHYAVAFGVAASIWGVSEEATVLGYLQAWATNAVATGVKSIPLGQTAGQALLLGLDGPLAGAARAVATWADDDLGACGWGLSLASMAHEQQYSRLYRS